MDLSDEQRQKICGHMEFAISRLRALQASSISSREALETVDVLDSALLKLQSAGESIYGVERVVNPGREKDSKEPHYLDIQYPNGAWKDARHVRNIVSHAYVAIDNDIIWDIIQNHVEALIEAMDDVIRAHQPSGP